MCSEMGLTPWHPRHQQIHRSWTLSRGARSLVQSLPGRRPLHPGFGCPVSAGLWHVSQAPVVGAHVSQRGKVAHSPSCPEVCLQASCAHPRPPPSPERALGPSASTCALMEGRAGAGLAWSN